MLNMTAEYEAWARAIATSVSEHIWNTRHSNVDWEKFTDLINKDIYNALTMPDMPPPCPSGDAEEHNRAIARLVMKVCARTVFGSDTCEACKHVAHIVRRNEAKAIRALASDEVIDVILSGKWTEFDAKTDVEIKRDAASDPDAGPVFTEEEMVRLLREGKARIVKPKPPSRS